MTGRLSDRLGAILLAALVLLSAVGGVAIAATSALDPTGEYQQNPYIETDVTKDVHEIAWGTDTQAALTYEANDGGTATLDAVVNTTAEEPYTYTPTDVNFSDAGAFPHAKEDVSALTAAEWTTSSASVSDVTTAPGVDAVEIATSAAPGSATFANFSTTSDAQKRYLQVVYDITSVGAGATVELRALDADGDYVALTLANETGEGYIAQAQIGALTVEGTGDGTMSEIQKLELNVTGATATVQISALNADKLGEWTFGEKLKDTDSDDALETVTVTDKTTAGPLGVTSLSTLGPAFDSATIHDLTFQARFYGSLQGQSDSDISFREADSYPSFSHFVDLYYRLKLPSAYDLSYANAELMDRVKLPGNRYVTVEYAEGTGDTAFTDVSSWTGVTSNYGTQATNVTIDQTIQPGTAIAYHAEYLVTADGLEALQSGGITGPMGGDGGGGFFSSIWGWIAGIAGSVAVFFGLKQRGS